MLYPVKRRLKIINISIHRKSLDFSWHNVANPIHEYKTARKDRPMNEPELFKASQTHAVESRSPEMCTDTNITVSQFGTSYRHSPK